MKKFIKYTFIFSVLTILVLAVLVAATTVFAKKSFDYSIPQNKNILIVGDSHTESAINDSILNNAYNLSQSGTGYFYSYLKAREVINHNPQIDTLIVGYSYSSIKKTADEWFTGAEKIKFKIRDHFFLINLNDFKELLFASPKNTLVFTPQVIAHNFKVLGNGYAQIGGFQNLKRYKLKEDITRLQNEDITNDKVEFSVYQKAHLINIYKYCEEKKVKLILINAPIHEVWLKRTQKYVDHYCEFYTSNMPNALLINNTYFNMPDSGFADATHLNYKGAKIYTEYLIQTKFAEDLSYCNRIKP
jgi:hypothetical protein